MRSRAVKALTSIIEADSSILGLESVQKVAPCLNLFSVCLHHQAVCGRFLDQAISVREAVVDLVGRHVQHNERMMSQYYPKIIDRILDTGRSVRRRVVKVSV